MGEPEFGSFGEAEFGSFGEAEFGSFGEPEFGSFGEPEFGSFGEPEFGSMGEPEFGSLGEPEFGSLGEGREFNFTCATFYVEQRPVLCRLVFPVIFPFSVNQISLAQWNQSQVLPTPLSLISE